MLAGSGILSHISSSSHEEGKHPTSLSLFAFAANVLSFKAWVKNRTDISTELTFVSEAEVEGAQGAVKRQNCVRGCF